MLLAIDAGNTNVVFAVFEGEACRRQWRSATDAQRTADEYAVWLNQLMALDGLKPADIDGAIIANVVPAAQDALVALCRDYFDCAPLVVGERGLDLGIGVLLEHPEEVGADRLVNAVAVHERYRGPAIVIDFGTATTFDVVDGKGNYCGGVIAPGVNLSLEALHMAAAKLPRIPVQKPDTVIGKGTIAAMRSGVYWGYIGLIEGLVTRVKAEFGAAMSVIATGGLAPLFIEGTDVIEHHDPDLTLRGLMLIHRRARKT